MNQDLSETHFAACGLIQSRPSLWSREPTFFFSLFQSNFLLQERLPPPLRREMLQEYERAALKTTLRKKRRLLSLLGPFSPLRRTQTWNQQSSAQKWWPAKLTKREEWDKNNSSSSNNNNSNRNNNNKKLLSHSFLFQPFECSRASLFLLSISRTFLFQLQFCFSMSKQGMAKFLN